MIKEAQFSSLMVRATLSFFAVVFSSAVPGAAQVHGVPASVLSMRTTPGFNRMGVPSSVTSLGQHGYNVPSCRRGFVVPRAFGHLAFDYGQDRFRHRISPLVYVYYSYTQPAVYPINEPPQNQQQEVSSAYQSGYEQGRLENEVQQLRQEVADLKESQMPGSRLQATAEPNAARPSSSEPNTKQSQDSLLEPVAVLVLHDARTVELHDYIIASGSIWNLAEERMEKISLDDLDIDATRELNESRGLSRNAAAILDAVNNMNSSAR